MFSTNIEIYRNIYRNKYIQKCIEKDTDNRLDSQDIGKLELLLNADKIMAKAFRN